MASTTPRLTPTLALTAAWVVIYMLYLAVRPDPQSKPKAVVTTTTTTSEAEDGAAPPR
jgi:hypothetical protein